MGAVKSIGPRRFYSKSNNGERGSGKGWNILRGYGGMRHAKTFMFHRNLHSAIVKIGFHAL